MDNHRIPIILLGDQYWCLEQVKKIINSPQSNGIWLGENCLFPNFQQLTIKTAKKCLGQTTSYLIFNAHSGFDLDALGITTGCLQGGGIFCLLLPALEQLENWHDQGFKPYLSYPYQLHNIQPAYFFYLKYILTTIPLTLLKQGNTNLPSFVLKTTQLYKTTDQAKTVLQICKTANGRARRPLIITAPRGRGKSSALGIAIKQLLETTDKQIIISAPRKSALLSCFQYIDLKHPCLIFLAPDQLTQTLPPADLLIVDEAASIPIFLLTKWLAHYARTIFCSTIEGYEGGAGGFYLRFKALLEEKYPAFYQIQLEQPIRWSINDPLEFFIKKALLLDSQPFSPLLIKECQPIIINKIKLAQDPIALSSFFGLFRIAHYRTRPNNLRQLLDAPDSELYALQYQNKLFAAAVCIKEGGLETNLCQQILQGKRRIQGHLSAQNLIYYQNNLEAGEKTYYRINRIAVIPALQNQRFATKLIQFIKQTAEQGGFDYLSCSFGATSKLLSFWQKNNFQAVYLSQQIETSSNTHSLLMLKPLNKTADNFLKPLQIKFNQQILQQLPFEFKNLDPDLVPLLLKSKNTFYINPEIQTEVRLFTDYQRSFVASKMALTEYLIAILKAGCELKLGLLIELLIQQKPFNDVILTYQLKGKKALFIELKKQFKAFLPLN